MNAESTHDLPDTSAASPVAPPVAPPREGTDELEQILPPLRELAQKVGGFRKLAEIVLQLDRGG
jgi:hypothetical protein